MLSDNDFRSKFGKDIAIFPFKKENVEGASIYVTASEYAWSLKTKKKICSNGEITIPKNDTAIIITQESVYLSENVAGACHSRVRLALRGLGHLGTPMKPGCTGRLLIAIHNHAKDENKEDEGKDVVIGVNEHIAVLMFHKLTSKAEVVDQKNLRIY